MRVFMSRNCEMISELYRCSFYFNFCSVSFVFKTDLDAVGVHGCICICICSFLLFLLFAGLSNSRCQNPFKYSNIVVVEIVVAALVCWSTLQLGSDFGLLNMHHPSPLYCLTLCPFVFAICGLLFVAKKLKFCQPPGHPLAPSPSHLPQCHPAPLLRLRPVSPFSVDIPWSNFVYNYARFHLFSFPTTRK